MLIKYLHFLAYLQTGAQRGTYQNPATVIGPMAAILVTLIITVSIMVVYMRRKHLRKKAKFSMNENIPDTEGKYNTIQ